jgi:hypothetical protein
MDIMLPRLEQQVSPPPRLIARRGIDVPHLVRKLLSDSPELGVDEIVARLKELNIQASGVIVAMWLMKERTMGLSELRVEALIMQQPRAESSHCCERFSLRFRFPRAAVG